jgi:uncharacterized protein (DUF2235 family)
MMTGISRANEKVAKEQDAIARYFELAREFKSTLSGADCLPWFVGVWDTVSSVGWIENPLKLPYIANNPDIQIGRHAIAIDERRAFFRNHLWIRPDSASAPYGPKDVKQVWFPGVHSDVGGGYSESESGLAKIALEWMLAEGIAHGLLVNAAKQAEILGKTTSTRYAPPDPNAIQHESLTGAWNIAEFVWKKCYDWRTGKERRVMNLYRRRTIPSTALVHGSAFVRSGGYRDRLPPGAVRVDT